VLGDLHNTTGRPVLDKSVEQALRLSLGQSRHVNVLSDQKVRDTLARMRKSPDTPIDRDLAAEIAIRDGAWGVILPTVSEVGGRVHVTLELVEPRTREVNGLTATITPWTQCRTGVPMITVVPRPGSGGRSARRAAPSGTRAPTRVPDGSVVTRRGRSSRPRGRRGCR